MVANGRATRWTHLQYGGESVVLIGECHAQSGRDLLVKSLRERREHFCSCIALYRPQKRMTQQEVLAEQALDSCVDAIKHAHSKTAGLIHVPFSHRSRQCFQLTWRPRPRCAEIASECDQIGTHLDDCKSTSQCSIQRSDRTISAVERCYNLE